MYKKITVSFILMAICLLATPSASAQSWKNLFKKDNIKDVVESVAGQYVEFSIVGSWNYTGSATKLESSESTVAELGASVASSAMEEKINTQLEKVGIKKGLFSLNFTSDSAMTIVTASKTINCTYTYDKEANQLTIRPKIGLPITCDVDVLASSIAILFKSNGLLNLAKTISGSTHLSSMETISSLLDSYDGMKLGLNFEKKK